MANGIVLTGDWRKLRHKFERYTALGEMVADEALFECAELVRDTLHEVVNSAPSPANSPKTVKRKGFNYPLSETGAMQDNNSIVVDSYEDVSGTTGYIIKGNPYKTHERSGTEYEDIVYMNSVGGGNLPARDMLGIAYDICRADIEKLTRTKVNDWLRR